MLLFPFFGLPSYQLTLNIAPQLLEACRGTASTMSTWARSIQGSLLPMAMVIQRNYQESVLKHRFLAPALGNLNF